jgi:hypothetical protein
MNRRNAARQRQLLSDFPANQGELYGQTVAVNAAYDAAKYPVILATGGAPGITVTLPDVADTPEKFYYVKKVDAGAGAVTVAAQAGEFIDGAANVALPNQYDALGIVSDGTDWQTLIPAGWGGGGVVPPAGYCWLYCVANRTTYGGTGAATDLSSPGGDDNVALGYRAMYENVTGDHNVCIGSSAALGVAANSFSYCVVVGSQAGLAITTGDNNVLVGYSAGTSLTTAEGAVCVGYRAGDSLTNGSSTTCVGSEAGGDLTSEIGNTYVGTVCGAFSDTGWYNTAVGSDSHFYNDGYYNACLGAYSGHGEAVGTTDFDNSVYIGYYAGRYVHNGDDNVAVGYYALRWNETGANNVCIGSEAGEGVANNNHSNNVLVGYHAGTAVTTGGENVGVGFEALNSITIGEDNTCLGYRAGDLLTTGTHNICVGTDTDPPANNSTYRLNIGDTIFGDMTANVNTVGINEATIAAQLHVNQDQAAGAIPVLQLEQADIDVVLAKVVASANAAGVDYTLVADSDFGTPGALVGWIQVEIQDDGNRITDGDYYIPFYDAPS